MKTDWFLGGVLTLSLIAGLTAQAKDTSGQESPKVIKVLDDFESGADSWSASGSGKLKGKIETSDAAKEGKKAAKITFSGEKAEGSWLNAAMNIEDCPKGIGQVSFWAKADKACKVKVAATESQWPEAEIYAIEVEIGTEWKKYTLTVKEFSEHLDWGMEGGDKKFDAENITKFGFRPVDVPATFTIDQIQFEEAGKEEKKPAEKKEGGMHDDHDKPVQGHGDSHDKKGPAAKKDLPELSEKPFPVVVFDFEGPHVKKWRKYDSGTVKSNVEFSDNAKEGKKSGKISFAGTLKAGSWSDLYYELGVGNWPKGGDTVTFWARADKECKAKLKINQGESHDEMEMYGQEFTVGKEWKKYSLPIDKMALIWSHIDPSSGRIVPEIVYGIGFNEVDFPVEFFVDQIQIEKSGAGGQAPSKNLKEGAVTFQEQFAAGSRDKIHRVVDFKGYVESTWMNKKYPFDRSVDEIALQEVNKIEGEVVNVTRTTARGKNTFNLTTAAATDDMRGILPNKKVITGESWTVDEKGLKKIFQWVEGDGIIRNGLGNMLSASLTASFQGIRDNQAVVGLTGDMGFYYAKGQVTITTKAKLAGELLFDIPKQRIVRITLKADMDKTEVTGTWDYLTGKGDLGGKLLNGLIDYHVELNTPDTSVLGAKESGDVQKPVVFPVDYPGGVIGFHSLRDGDYEVYLMDSKGQNLRNITKDSGSYDWNVDFFPDGKRIAFVSNRATKDFQQIYVANLDGTGAVQLTQDGANGHHAVSPDGKRIAFTSTRDAPADNNTHNGELYVMDADGKNQTRLTDHKAKDGVPTWSPDGKKIAFMSNRKDHKSSKMDMDIWVIDLETKELTQVTKDKSDDFEPAWSPDGKKIAFASDRDGIFEQNIYTVDVESGKLTQLTRNQSINWYPQWSPDGTWLTFMTSRHGNWEVYTMRADGTDQIRLTNHPAFDRYPSWGPSAR